MTRVVVTKMELRKILKVFVAVVSVAALSTMIASVTMRSASMMPLDYRIRKRPLRTSTSENPGKGAFDYWPTTPSKDMSAETNEDWPAVRNEDLIAEQNHRSPFASNSQPSSASNGPSPTASKDDMSTAVKEGSLLTSKGHRSSALSSLLKEHLPHTPKEPPSYASQDKSFVTPKDDSYASQDKSFVTPKDDSLRTSKEHLSVASDLPAVSDEDSSGTPNERLSKGGSFVASASSNDHSPIVSKDHPSIAPKGVLSSVSKGYLPAPSSHRSSSATNKHLSFAPKNVLSALSVDHMNDLSKKDSSVASNGHLSSVSRDYLASASSSPLLPATVDDFSKTLINFITTSKGHLASAPQETSRKVHSPSKLEDRNFSEGRSSLSRRRENGRPRILCWIPSTENSIPSGIRAINETWISRCDGHVFFVEMKENQAESAKTKRKYSDIISLGVQEGRHRLTEKSVAALTYLYLHALGDFEWFVKADDDTYLVLENLRLLLSHYDPGDPVYLGRLFKKHVRQGYMSGGASYVLSKEAMKKLVEEGFLAETCPRHRSEDVAIGRCLEKVGVLPHNSRDKLGREAFNPENVFKHMGRKVAPLWLYAWDRFETRGGRDCCSELSISFHHMPPYMIYTVDQLLYGTTVYGKIPDWTRLRGLFQPGAIPPPSDVDPQGARRHEIWPAGRVVKPTVKKHISHRSSTSRTADDRPHRVTTKELWVYEPPQEG